MMTTNTNGQPARRPYPYDRHPHPHDLKPGPTREAWAWIIAQSPFFLWLKQGDMDRLQGNVPSAQPQQVDWSLLWKLIQGPPKNERR